MDRLPEEITENGIHYTLHGDYYFPDLVGPKEDRPIGKWGRMQLDYLKECKPGLYTQLILSGELYHCLADLNDQAQARLELIIRQMKEAEKIDEGMKGADQMEWVRRMNSIRQRAEEVMLQELVYM